MQASIYKIENSVYPELLGKLIGLFIIRSHGNDEYSLVKGFRKRITEEESKSLGFSCTDELVYCVLHNTKPEDHVCSYCGCRTRFYNFKEGYRTTCGKTECKSHHFSDGSMWSDEIRAKRISTYIDRFGAATSYASPKAKDTIREKYGCDNVFSNPDIKSKIRQWREDNAEYLSERISEGKLNQDRTAFRDHVRETRKSQIDKKQDELNATLRETLVGFYGRGWECIPEIRKYLIKVTDVYPNMTLYFFPNDKINLIKDYASTNHTMHSNGEKQVVEFIKSVYDGSIIENDRKVLGNKLELDIYIPEKNIAIEFNGDYYHKDDKDRMNLKTNRCISKGIRLIHIWENEWNNKRSICKSIISSALGIYDDKISARECKVVRLSYKECSAFYDINHIHGHSSTSKWNYGLKYNGELVQVISLGKYRFSDDDTPELYRMCTRINTCVRGGFSKLIKYFLNDTNNNEVVSFVDKAIFNASGYKNIGFEMIGESAPSYRYYNPATGKSVNHQATRKDKLSDLLGNDNYHPELTEHENMKLAGWWCHWDCGNLKLKYTKH